MKAFIYTRVSSEEQVSNLSLDVQEKTCRDYCARNGWKVEAVYREEGESAKTADRTVLRQMLAALRERPGLVEYVVVYDTSRFARDVYVHASLKQLLMKSGARLRAATQPLEDTAAGRAIEGVFAVFNQLDNELRAEKVTAGMKETVARGRWPWAAPLGYKNDRRDGRKVVVLDDLRARLLKKVFESVASGDAPADVLRRVTALGLVSKKGRTLRLQELTKLLRNPFYKGLAKSSVWGIETNGEHPALVDAATWARVQFQLGGRAVAPGRPPRKKQRPDFPLRGFVRCTTCGSPLTASNSRGKTGRTYPYYRCWVKSCSAKVQIRADRLEERFTELLRRLELTPGMVRLVEAALLDIWNDLRKQATEEAAAVRRRISNLEHRKKRFVEAYVVEQAIDRTTYQREIAAADEALTLLHLELHDATLEDLDLEAALGFASHVLTRTSTLWEAASPEQKRRLQTLIFPEGITFDGEALETPVTALLFRLLGPDQTGEVNLVEQKGFEPSTPTLRTWCSPS
jgi:site-specific DNA recombinase